MQHLSKLEKKFFFQVKVQTPFTAGGLFNVERSTLTTIVGTTLTYLIILVQFAQSESE